MITRSVLGVIQNVLAVLAAAALLYPGGRKLLFKSWREDLDATYRLGGRRFSAGFFLLVGLLEVATAIAILVPQTRVPAAFAMVGFFVGALFFNLALRADPRSVPAGQPDAKQLIPLDIAHGLLGLAVALV